MSVTVVDSGGQSHTFQEASEVQGNSTRATAEGARQIGFAKRELIAREAETRVTQDGVPDPNGKFVNVGLISSLKEAIARDLPAVVVGSPANTQAQGGPIVVTIGGSTFALDSFWPGQSGAPSVATDTGRTAAPAPITAPPESLIPGQSRESPPPQARDESTISSTGNNSEPITNPQENGGGISKRSPSAGDTSKQSESQSTNGKTSDGKSASTLEPSENTPSGGKPSSGNNSSGDGSDGNTVTKVDGNAKKVGGNGGNAGLTTDLSKIKIKPQANPLDAYDSYTYNIALYMLTPKEYVKMLKNPLNPQSAKKILICRSGGIGNDGGKEFDVDFYLDDLKLKNMATSPSKSTTNTNAISVSFNINEPRGVTFIERLKEQAKEALEDEQSYIHTPYLLEIKFKGYDELGKPVENIGKPKYIPIKILNMRFSIEETGAIYKCKAIPYHHEVFNKIRSYIPINVQVKAGTVGDILAGKVVNVNKEVVRPTQGEETPAPVTKSVLGEASTTLPDAVNKFFDAQTVRTRTYIDPKTKKKETIAQEAGVSDKWIFDMPPDMLNAKIITQRISALNSPQKTQKLYKQYGATMKGKINLDATNKYFTVNKGTSLIQLINYLLVGSTYITAPLIDTIDKKKNTKENTTNKPIQWFKVKPRITGFRGWDKKEGRYKFEITWTIETNGIYYNDYPHANQAKPKEEGVHKVYDYIFTGNNTHITNLRLDFNNAYYEAQTLGAGNPTDDKTPNSRSPMRKSVTTSIEGQTISDDSTKDLKRGKDLMTSIMQDGIAMIQTNISIIGDPAYLPTGDSFWQPQGNDNKIYSSPFLPDGTINYDLTAPYFQLNFKTPTGYDDLSGLSDPSSPANKKYGSDEFNGVYQVLTVASSFTAGIFSQDITAFKAKMQPINTKVGRSREALVNNERNAIARDNNILKQLTTTLPGITAGLNNGLAKITSLANSSITNIATNIIPPSITREIEQNLPQVVNEVGEIVQQILSERAGNNTDLLVNEDV